MKKELSETQLVYNQRIENKLKEGSYEQKKKEFDRLKQSFFRTDTDETINKYKILQRAYELGKQIYKIYSVKQLSIDFDIPYTTTKRVLSLERANPRTWDLINQGKISAFKVAQICLTKNITFQDKVVELVIKKNLSTYEIKKLRINKIGDIKQVKLEKAVKDGFARRDTAYTSLKNTLLRLNILLNLKKDDFPEDIPHLVKLLKYSKDKIENKIKEFENDN